MKLSGKRPARAIILVLVLVLMLSFPVSASSVPSVLPEEPDSTKTLKVLFVGNSFSVDTSRYLYQIAKDAGYRLKIGDAWIGGLHLSEMYTYSSCDLSKFTYMENTGGTWKTLKSSGSSLWRLRDVLKRASWDVIIINQYSADAGNMGSFYSNSSVKGDSFLSMVAGYIHKRCPGASLGYNMTWAFPRNSTAANFSTIYGGSQKQMFRMICDTTQVLLEGLREEEDLASFYGSRTPSLQAVSKGTELIDFMIPSGTAIQNARSSYMGDTLNRDQKHLSLNYGRYIAGLCAAASLGIPIEDISKPHMGQAASSLTMSVMRKSVLSALETPYEVTGQKKTAPVMADPEVSLRVTSKGYVKASWPVVRGASGYKVVYKKGGSKAVYTKTLPAGERSIVFKGKEGKNTVTVYALGDTYIKGSAGVTETVRIRN